MELREAIQGWQGFYAAVANAGAALVGLVFVGVSLHLSRGPLDAQTRRVGYGSAITLIHPFTTALVMLLPVAPALQGLGLLLLASVELVLGGRFAYAQARPPRRASGLLRAYRSFVPLGAAAILAAGAVGLIAGWRFGIYAPAVYVFLMINSGLENAWALLVGQRSS